MGDDSELRRHLDELAAEVAALRAAVQSLEERATGSDYRADATDARADRASHRADVSEARADRAEHRADVTDELASSQKARVGELESRVDVNQALLLELQESGELTSEHAANLEEALRSSRLIGEAMGMVMGHRAVDEERAFEALSKRSQDTNRKLRVVAEDIVRSGDISELPSA